MNWWSMVDGRAGDPVGPSFPGGYVKNIVAALKLVEFGSRSALVLACLFVMPDAEAARFGTTTLFIGIFCLVAGFERYVDLQRTIHSAGSASADAALSSALRLFALQHAWALPCLYLALHHAGGLSAEECALAVAVAIGEHAAQECYRAAISSGRHWNLVAISAARSLAVASVMGVTTLVRPEWVTLTNVLGCWAALGALSLAAMLPTVVGILRSGYPSPPIPVLKQFRASRWHFATGVLALVAYQADRLIAIGVLGPDALATFFRAVMLAGAASQLLAFASFNRISRELYAHLSRREADVAQRAARRERIRYCLVLSSLPLLVAVAPFVAPPSMRLPPWWAVALASSSALARGIADFDTIFLNHARRERDVLWANAAGLFVTLACSIPLGIRLGLAGVLAGGSIGGIATCLMIRSLFRSAERQASGAVREADRA
jgi:hypothetical protein